MTPNLRSGSVKPTRVVNRQMNQIGHKTSTQCICREEKGNQLYEIIMFLQRLVKFLHPKVEFAEAIQVSDTNLSIGNFSKQTKLGRNELFKFLRENKILFIDNGSNVPYQKYIDRRYFVCTQVVTNNHINVITKVTTKGQEWLFKKFPQLKRKE